MSTNIEGLVNRVYREYLEPNDDVQSFTYLTTAIDNTATSIVYNNSVITSEEEDAMSSGNFIEINRELMLITAIDTASTTLTVMRGARGTDKDSHGINTIIKINPPFPRKNVFDAVSDQITNLYPTLYAVETKELTTGTGYTLLDSSGDNYLVTPIKAISQYTDWSSGSDQTGLTFKGVAVEMIDLPNPFTYTNSSGSETTVTFSTGPDVVHAVQWSGIASGHTAYVTFKKKFVQPTAETDTLATIGLEDEYEPIIMAGVAAHMLSGRDIPAATSEFITAQL